MGKIHQKREKKLITQERDTKVSSRFPSSRVGQREWVLVYKREIDLILKKEHFCQTEGALDRVVVVLVRTLGSSFMIVFIFLMIEEAGSLARMLRKRRCAVV